MMLAVSFVCFSSDERLKLFSSVMPGLGRHWATSYNQTEIKNSNSIEQIARCCCCLVNRLSGSYCPTDSADCQISIALPKLQLQQPPGQQQRRQPKFEGSTKSTAENQATGRQSPTWTAN